MVGPISKATRATDKMGAEGFVSLKGLADLILSRREIASTE